MNKKAGGGKRESINIEAKGGTRTLRSASRARSSAGGSLQKPP